MLAMAMRTCVSNRIVQKNVASSSSGSTTRLGTRNKRVACFRQIHTRRDSYTTVVIPRATAANDTATDVSPDAANAVATAFVDAQVKSNMRVGVTSGNIIGPVLSLIHDKLAAGSLTNVVAVPADALAAKECAVAGVLVSPFERNEDGKLVASEVDVLALSVDELVVGKDGKIAAIFGRAQRPVQPDLQSVAKMAAKAKIVVCLATHSRDEPIEECDALFEDSKDSNTKFIPLGGKVPICMAYLDKDQWDEDAENLDDVFLGDAEVWRRGAELNANPRGGGNPYLSPSGMHTIVDLCFYDPKEQGSLERWEDGLVLLGEAATPEKVREEIESCDGVLAHGLVTTANLAYVSEKGAEGTLVVRKIEAK